jgi:hypothetical protein
VVGTLVAGVCVLGVFVGAGAAAAVTSGATISVTPAAVTPGDQAMVTLENWPTGVATAMVCGNRAQRDSEDCNQVASDSEDVPPSGTTTFLLAIATPPVGCPCVVRVTTNDGALVRTAPIDLAGVPDGVDIPPASGPPDARQLVVQAGVRTRAQPWPAAWSQVFAGPASRELVLQMHNVGTSPISGLRVVGVVGRGGLDGEPFGMPIVGAVAPGQRRTVVVPFQLAAPAHGDYVARGSVYGLSAPIQFRTTTSSEPWGLELLVPLALLLLAQLMRHRERARERSTALPVEVEAVDDHASEAFAESSPRVGDGDPGHWGAPPYDHAHVGPEVAPGRRAAPLDMSNR